MIPNSRIGTFTEEHEALRRTVRRFVEERLVPNARAWEAAGEFPLGLYREAAAVGLFGLRWPAAYGGSDAGAFAEAIVAEELGRCRSGGVAAGLGAHAFIAMPPIGLLGTEAQKRRWLAPAIEGALVGALAITEPGAGSDVAGLTTRARRDGDAFVLDGAKTFITNGARADFYVVAARTNDEPGHAGLSLLVVEQGTPGFTVGRRLDKLGWRASDTAELHFEGCRVPAANLVGDEGAGFFGIMANFQWERLAMALGATAAAEQILEDVTAFVKERRAFGRPIAGFQVTRHKLADLALELEAARQLGYHALRLHAAGEDAITEVTMAKRLATESCCRIADEALQLHGGAGYMMEYDVQRHWRDARLGPIGGGTREIMNEILAKRLGL